MKTKKTLYLAIVSGVNLVLTSIIGLILGRLILENFGSDYNGLNSTITQIVYVLSIFEGGFTTASLVAVFKPIGEKDDVMTNAILAHSKKVFYKIGLAIAVVGLIITFPAALILKTNIDFVSVVLIFSFAILSNSFRIGIVAKYLLPIQGRQDDYISTIIDTLVTLLVQAIAAYCMIRYQNLVLFRFVFSLATVLGGIAIILYSKKKYPNITYSSDIKVNIKGTKDLFISKVTSAIYSSSTIIFISSVISTSLASVYSIYNSIISMVKSILYVVINSPKNAFGIAFAENDANDVFPVYQEYEYIVILAISIIFPSALIMTDPFVSIYTAGITDINYHLPALAIMLVIIAVLECIHIPSGICINMSGDFSTVKKIQLLTCIELIILEVFGSIFFGFYGILMAMIITNITLAAIEIVFTRKIIFAKSLKDFTKTFAVNFMPAIILYYPVSQLINSINWNFLNFFAIGFVLLLGFAVLTIVLNYVFEKTLLKKTIERFKIIKRS